MQQRIKKVFTEELIQTNPFIRNLHKSVRKVNKKLEMIAKIEEKERSGQALQEEEIEKLQKKVSLN